MECVWGASLGNTRPGNLSTPDNPTRSSKGTRERAPRNRENAGGGAKKQPKLQHSCKKESQAEKSGSQSHGAAIVKEQGEDHDESARFHEICEPREIPG